MIYFLPLIVLLLSFGQAHAYTTQTPEISGYNNRTMKLTGGSGGFSGGTYSRTGTVMINGKTVPIPGSLKPSTGMGAIVKNALKLNPYKIAGTLAAGWLIDQGLQWMDDSKQWVKSAPAGYPYGSLWYGGDQFGPCGSTTGTGCGLEAAVNAAYLQNQPTWPKDYCNYLGGTGTRQYECGYTYSNSYGTGTNTTIIYVYEKGPAPATPVPMTDADWNALADPMPTVGAELPTADYLPEGVTIVEPPAYIPQTVTVGAPYTKADGSTAQPMAKISPAGDGQVTIDTFEQPLTNPDATPVPTGTPTTDTKEDPPPPKDPCIENPQRLGCVDIGEAPADPEINKTPTPLTFNPLNMGGNATCPATEFLTIGGAQMEVNYGVACGYASGLRPIVVAVAFLSALYIIFGVKAKE